MGLFDQLQNVLTQYAGGNTPGPENPQDVESHFSQVAAVAPQSSLAEGLAAAFRSNQTPAFGQMVSNLFSQSSGDQKAGLLNQLMSSMPPGAVQSLLGAGAGGGALAGLLQSGSSECHSRTGAAGFARGGTAIGSQRRKARSLDYRYGEPVLCPTFHAGENAGRNGNGAGTRAHRGEAGKNVRFTTARLASRTASGHGFPVVPTGANLRHPEATLQAAEKLSRAPF